VNGMRRGNVSILSIFMSIHPGWHRSENPAKAKLF
jgi:hypothetical protein